mmetsp:Transcript_15710/g.24404  ORF Transcript_15710/g.24404 Transcript_15710/m.24404 type:complete len:101 (+) Transcript_15710:2001-2303(+)
MIRVPRGDRISVEGALEKMKSCFSGANQPILPVNTERDCMLCLSAPRTARLVCGHSVCCNECLLLLQRRRKPQCLVCRADLEIQEVRVGVANEDTFLLPI